MDPDWAQVLRRRLAEDQAFSEAFRQHPGQAAASLGVPYERFQELWPAFAEQYDLAPPEPD